MQGKAPGRKQYMPRKALLDHYTKVSVLDGQSWISRLGQTMKDTACHTIGSGYYDVCNEDQLKVLRRSSFTFGLIIRTALWKKN